LAIKGSFSVSVPFHWPPTSLITVMAGVQVDVDLLAAIAHAEKQSGQQKSHTFDNDYPSDHKHDPEVAVEDGIHDGLEFPTEEEKMALRRVADTIPWNAYRG
jgi:POT family proton-dependent oligopeptide transporter